MSIGPKILSRLGNAGPGVDKPEGTDIPISAPQMISKNANQGGNPGIYAAPGVFDHRGGQTSNRNFPLQN